MRQTILWTAAIFVLLVAHVARADQIIHQVGDFSTRLKVLSPEGSICKVTGDSAWVADKQLEVPFSIPAVKNTFYTLTCRLPNGASWHKKVEAKANHTTVVRIGAAAGPASSAAPMIEPKKKAMSSSDFARLLKQINDEAFAEKKISALRLAAGSNYFNTSQVGQLIDAMSFGDDKVKVVEVTHKRIIDPKNHHTLLGHFTFSSNKEKAQKILSRR